MGDVEKGFAEADVTPEKVLRAFKSKENMKRGDTR
jgi:hypothetical protein